MKEMPHRDREDVRVGGCLAMAGWWNIGDETWKGEDPGCESAANCIPAKRFPWAKFGVTLQLVAAVALDLDVRSRGGQGICGDEESEEGYKSAIRGRTNRCRAGDLGFR